MFCRIICGQSGGNTAIFRSSLPEILFFFRSGDFLNFTMGPVSKLSNRWLSPLKKNRRSARYGFPVAYAMYYLRSTIILGKSVVVIMEGDSMATTKERHIVCRYETVLSRIKI